MAIIVAHTPATAGDPAAAEARRLTQLRMATKDLC
jgi:hypothetical protein